MPAPADPPTEFRPSRRAVTRGAAWAAPVVLLSTAAPAFAVSPCAPNGNRPLVAITGSGSTARTMTITPTTNCVYFTLTGGGGQGAYDVGGNGWRLTGVLNGVQGKTLTLTAGGGGTATVGGQGFGRGGTPIFMTPPSGYTASQVAWGGGGGGGSAITVGGTALVIAGGGGGGAALWDLWSNNPFPTSPFTYMPIPNGGNSGYVNGSAGDTSRLTNGSSVTVTGIGGGGAVGGAAPTGGVGAALGARTGISNVRQVAGLTGGAASLTTGGAGANGTGGPTTMSIDRLGYYLAVASGAGGGGYSGGGSGSATIGDINPYIDRFYHILATGGAGGGGSSYAGNAGGITVTVLSNSNGGTGGPGSAGPADGLPGSVSLTY